jgi:histidine triad (HIT) family protein
MGNCVFCGILTGKLSSSTVYRDEICSVFMDIQPVNAGHLLVIPNQHAAALAELDEETGAHMFRIAQRLAQALRESGVPCQGVNLFLADGAVAGQEVFHVHLHVIPRYRGDGLGFRFGPNYGVRPPRRELDGIAQQISDAL